MSDDEKRRAPRSSQRPIAPPALPEGALRAFKVVMYSLYREAGSPPLTDIADEIKDLARNLAGLLFPVDEDGEAEVDSVLGRPSVGRDVIGAIIGGGTLPGTEDDAVAVAVSLAAIAGRLTAGTRTRELAPLAHQIRTLWTTAQIPPPVSWGTQPLVAESRDLESRVLRAAIPIPYIRRDKEDEARAHLAEGRPLLLIGPSMVGKTRLAVELIRDLYGDRRLFLPDSRSALSALLTEKPPVTDCVVFLDDLDLVISASALSHQSFRRLIERNVVIATMRGRKFDEYQPTEAMRPPEWNLLGEFERVFLRSELSPEEKHLVLRAVENRQIGERILETGIGEYVGAADRVIDALQLAPSEKPLANAMILGCADWARAGAIAPVPAQLLRDLAAPHLSARQLARANDEDYDEALRWATREINPTVSLLQPELGQRYSVFTFALDLLSDRGDPIPDPSWLIVVDNAEAGDLIEIARAAARDRRPDITERALNLCEQRGEPGSAPLAAMYLGSVLNKRGERAEAKAAYHRAIASDHTDAKPAALIGLAVLLTEEGATGEAEQAYRQAILTNHGVLWPAAALHLGLLLAEAGDLDRAEEAFREPIDHPLNLELTMAKMRREAEANGVPVIFAFVDARARQPTPDVFLEAELCLAGVLVTKNDFEGAKQIYADLERAQPEWIRGVALSQLSSLLLTEGKDLARAQLCSERALPLVTGPLEAKVRGDLALIHSVRGDHATAEAYFVEAMEMGFPEVAVVAAYSLADFRLQRGDTEGAQEAIRLMNEYGSHEDGAPVLARLTESGTPPEARTD